ncbi:unnamed protein product, partial [Ixodes persulcatus]
SYHAWGVATKVDVPIHVSTTKQGHSREGGGKLQCTTQDEREPLHPGTVFYVRQGTQQQGTVVGPADTPRSYIVQTAAGRVRRTRKLLQALPQGNLPNNGKPPCPEEARQVTRSGRA